MNLFKKLSFIKSLLILLFSIYIFTINASDLIIFEEGDQPHFENDDYEVWVVSILNEKENAYINLSIFPKKKFRHWSYYKLKKSDRTHIVSSRDLKLIQKAGNEIIGILPFAGLEKGWSTASKKPWFEKGRIESSANLEDKEINYVTLKFGGHISPDTKNISLIQNGDPKFFSFKEIPVSFTLHSEWENKYNNEKDLISKVDSSNDPISGIYENDNIRYACIIEGNTYNLIRLEDSPDLIWRVGDIRASFNKTATPGIFKGGYRNKYTKELAKDHTFVWNGDFIEVIGEYPESVWITRSNKEYRETYTKIYSSNQNHKENFSNPKKWSGTGFALKNGYIVTNNHVTDEAANIEIFGVNGDFTKGYKAKVIGKDKVSDLAILQIEDPTLSSSWDLPPYSINYTMADVGEDVFALGYPLIGTMGEEVKLTNGIISSRSGFEGDVTNYQISVPIQPGNSGGPMFNENGELVGIICAKHEGTENVGYAIKTSYLKNLIESIASPTIIPTNNTLKGKALKDQVKSIRNNVFLIKCSK